MSDGATYRELGRNGFDVVCQFIAFAPAQIANDIAAFSGKVGQYIFISSASVYQKPPRAIVISEQTPTINPYWGYSQNKIASEAMLKAANGLSWTIVRPSHTVRTILPTMFNEGNSVAHRMQAGKPVIVAGDGTTPWTLTRSADFAVPLVEFFGRNAAYGEDFHITSDNAYTWDSIYRTIAAGFGGCGRYRSCAYGHARPISSRLGGSVTGRQDLGGLVRQQEDQADRRRFRLRKRPRGSPRRADQVHSALAAKRSCPRATTWTR